MYPSDCMLDNHFSHYRRTTDLDHYELCNIDASFSYHSDQAAFEVDDVSNSAHECATIGIVAFDKRFE